MYDIKELEQKWRKYKFMQVSHLFVYLAGFAMVILSSFIVYNYYQEYKKYQTEIERENRRLAVANAKIKREEEIKRALREKEKEKRIAQERERRLAEEKEREKKEKIENERPVPKDIPEPEEFASIKPEKKKHIRPKLNILVSNEPMDGDNPDVINGVDFRGNAGVNSTVIKRIESRFEDTKDYDDAMFLAKYYYSKGRYRKSEYWSMQANLIDSSKEDSWIIFSKSQAKQGKRADALRVLQAYFDRTGSMKIKRLIDKIRKGKKF